MDDNTSVWRGKFKTLKDYYKKTYESKTYEDRATGKIKPYFTLDKYEKEIDPDETLEDINKYDTSRKQQEIIKCANSFAYFCHKYVKILHPLHGLIPFILYNYQRKVIKDYEDHRFNVISKFRQGGLTTATLLWGMWRCMFDTDQQIMLLSKTDREATEIGTMVDRSVENLPDWLKPPKDGKWNDHKKMFVQTGGSLQFYSPEAARGKSATFLIIDEAAFIDDMDKHWKAMYPMLSTGGSCTLVSTVNGVGGWYHGMYINGKDKNNNFHVIDLDYWEHPDYNDEDWVEDQRRQLGDKGFRQEVLREFLGSGDTYFSQNVIIRLHEQTRINFPSRKAYPMWCNKAGSIAQLENEEHNKGALWIWKEPEEGQEYLICVDAGEGQQEKNDNSVFHILNQATLEQVAEFYSNMIPVHHFAQVINEIAIYYNSALVVIEVNQGPGSAVVSYLQHTMMYDNLYCDNTKKGSKPGIKPGIKLNGTNRQMYLQALQNRLTDNSVRINSARFVAEMHTFEYNPVSRKAEASRGQHDDAIMAMCIGLYVRDTLNRDVPIGVAIPKEISDTFKTDLYEEIKRGLMEGRPEDIFEEEPEDMLAPSKEGYLPVGMGRNTKLRKLLSEFAW